MGYRRIILRNMEKKGQIRRYIYEGRCYHHYKRFIEDFPECNFTFVPMPHHPNKYLIRLVAWSQ